LDDDAASNIYHALARGRRHHPRAKCESQHRSRGVIEKQHPIDGDTTT